MGMEVNGVAAASSYQSQNLQAAKPVSQVSSVTTTTDKSNEVVVDSAKSAASNVAVSVGQAADSEKNGSNANDNDKAKKQAESMADVKDIRKVLNNNTIAEFGYNEPTKRLKIKIQTKLLKRYLQRKLLRCLLRHGSLQVSWLMRGDKLWQ